MFGLWASFTQKSFSNIANIVILLFAFVVIYFGKQTGTTGGEIRHTEIRAGYLDVPAAKPAAQGEEEEDD